MILNTINSVKLYLAGGGLNNHANLSINHMIVQSNFNKEIRVFDEYALCKTYLLLILNFFIDVIFKIIIIKIKKFITDCSL